MCDLIMKELPTSYSTFLEQKLLYLLILMYDVCTMHKEQEDQIPTIIIVFPLDSSPWPAHR